MNREYIKPQAYSITVAPADSITYNFPGSMSMPIGKAKESEVTTDDDPVTSP